MITTRNLTKRFGKIAAVREVSLDVREGDRYGLLGPNGSGKSTLVRMLLGLVYATSGSITVLGEQVPRHAGRVLPEIGALVEEPAAYPHLSGRANLRLLDAAGPHGSRRTRRRRVDDALEQVGLAGIDRRPVRAYSLGMRQRLGLAAALVRPPRLLILDEPTNGLDPRGIRDIRDLLIGLNESGVTIFLSSHLLPEVSALCTRVGVLDSGALVLQEQLASLQEPTGRVLVSTDDPERAVAALDGLVEHRDGADLVVRSSDPAALNARLVAAGVPVRSLLVQRRSLEEIVLEVTGAGSDQFSVPAAGPREPGRLPSPQNPRSRRRRPSRQHRRPGRAVIAVELFKLVRRVRTWFSIALMCALPLVVAIFIAVTHLAPPPGQGSAFLSAVLDNGQLYPAAALALVLPVFLPVAVAVVAGDSIAGEASAGTLRYLLARPVGRTKLLVAKLVAVVTFTLAAVIAVTVTSYATGVLILGPSRASAVGFAPRPGLRRDRAGRGRCAHRRAPGGRGDHVAVRNAADHPRS